MKAGKTIRWSLIGLISLFVVTAAVLSLPQRANAAVKETLSNSIVKKALASGLRRCYETGAISPRVDKLSTFNSFEELIIGGTDENYVALPNGLTNVSDSAVSCKQLFMGYTFGGGDFEGLFNLAGRKASGFTTNEEKIALLRGMGYESATSGTNKQCVNYIYNYTYLGVPGETATKNVCVTDGKITIEESQSINCGGNDASLACRVPLVFEVSGSKVTIHDHDFDKTSEPVEYGGDWDDFVKKIERQLSTNFSSFDDGTVFYTFNRSNPLSDGGHGDDSYVMKASAVNNASQYLSLGLATQFSNSEKVSYYVSAIKNWFFDGINLESGTGTNSYWTCGIKDWNAYGSYTSINANMNGSSGCNCGIDITKARTTSNIYGISGDSFDASGSTTLDLSSTIVVIDSLVEASPSDTCEPSEDDSAAPIDDTEEAGESAEDVCYGSAGTLGMSWILCPILTWTSNGLNHIYGEIEQDYLRVDPSFVSTDNATYKAWQTFQNAANIILAILLLVVIFSQLTGIGIDNYGIKKILPRLIICAILINLSYFIAQFFVDISNIVGSSIRSLFESINPEIINTSAEGVSMPSHILGITVFAAGAGWLVAAIANPAILLGLLLALISGLFAVLMMWLILIVRQAGVIIAVIIAPVAFVLYLLPNTSKFTKSWWNLMKSLLLLYPLAGLLIGASFFISDLMVGSSADPNPNMVLPAMIMRVAPFFALPALFRKSVDAMGNLGTRIQGIGRNLSRATTNAARNADWYRNAQELGRERQLSRRAGYNLDGTKRTGIFAEMRENADNSAVGRRLGWQRNRRKATEAYIKAQNERQKDDYLSNQDNISATLLGQESKWEKEQIENQSALLDKGMMTSVDGGNFQSYDNPESVKEELVKRLSQSSEEQEAHYAENMALWKKLQSFKDKGYDKTADLWDDRRITDSNSRMMQQIKADVAANGDFKNGARTAYDIITSSGGRKAGAVAAARGSGASLANLRMERIPDFSGDELKALSAVAQGQQYTDADGNTQTPTVETQAMASELLLNALSDSQVRRRFKGADADIARQGAISAFKNNVDKYTDDKKDTEETYVNKNNPNQKFTFKRSQQGYLYDARTKKYIDEARVSRMFDRVY